MSPEKQGSVIKNHSLTSPIGFSATAAGLIFAGVYLFLLHTTNINWDEFNFLAGVYAIQQGWSLPSINNFHTVLYAWVTRIPGNEIDQILAARLVQMAIFSGSMFLLYQLSRTILEVPASLLVILFAMTYTDVVQHAYSFRFDTLCLFFSLLSTWLLVCHHSLTKAALAGLALAIALLISVKTIFWAIPIGLLSLVLVVYPRPGERATLRLLILIVTTLLAITGIHLLRLALTDADSAGLVTHTSTMASSIAHSGHKMFLEEGLLPKADYLFRGIHRNLGHWILMGLGTIIAVILTLSSSRERIRGLAVLLALLPLSSILIYRNSFPYFYVYVLPPAMIAAGLALEFLAEKANRISQTTSRLVFLFGVCAPLTTLFLYLSAETKEGIEKQRLVIDAVHTIYPDPVPYIDGYRMISSFHKQGFFMSTWGMENYHSRGEPIFESILRQSHPQMLVHNHPAFFGRGKTAPVGDERYRNLLSQDQSILRRHFINHWGPINVPGKMLHIIETNRTRTFEILIPGIYRLESEFETIIDSTLVKPQQMITLTEWHLISSPEPQIVTLRWAAAKPPPEHHPPDEWLFDGL